MSLLLKVTAEQLHSHGDGALPARGNDPDEPGEDGWVDVVPHRAIVIRVPDKPLHPEERKDNERKSLVSQCSRPSIRITNNHRKYWCVCLNNTAIKLLKENCISDITYPRCVFLVVCVLRPAYAVLTVFQGKGDDIHLFAHRFCSLRDDACDLLDLGQFYLKPLVHVRILEPKIHERSIITRGV